MVGTTEQHPLDAYFLHALRLARRTHKQQARANKGKTQPTQPDGLNLDHLPDEQQQVREAFSFSIHVYLGFTEA